ncbi:MAG: adenylate/guanylate cyclase domain-containing protein, partial [Chloroflexi bacterium]
MEVREQLERAIAAMEAQRGTLGDAVVDAALAAFREKLAALDSPVELLRAAGEAYWPVTVLAAELTGLDGLAEAQGQDARLCFIAGVWERLEAVIHNAGGVVGSRAGNQLSAVFGAQSHRPEDAEQAVRAALEMQEETKHSGTGAVPGKLQLRAGVNTGPAHAGADGVDLEKLKSGDTAGLANTLRAAAGPGEVLVAHATFRAVRGIFTLQASEPLGETEKTEPVAAYRVCGVRPRVFRLSAELLGRPGAGAPLVGREEELQMLQSALASV